jgi:micrococcal nuclease
MGQCLSALVDVVQAAAQEQEQQQQQQQQQHQQQQPHPTVSQPPATHNISSSSSSSLNASVSYPALPSNAEHQKVRNVYDGDTLTLTDGRRVRLLGIDCPEIKEQQPYAQEAKAYTKNLCSGQHDDVWISLEPNNSSEDQQQDHYGRLLAHVWVSLPPSSHHGSKVYLCVNEGLVAHGLASAYIPNANAKKLHNWDKLLQLQSRARKEKRGMWSSFQDTTVYKTSDGAAYHKRNCKHLAKTIHVQELQQSHAMDMGLHACRTCLG